MKVIYKLFLLVFWQILFSEKKREKDIFVAKVSASVQVAVLITLNFVSCFFVVYALLSIYFSIDAINTQREVILTIVGLLVLVLTLIVYRKVCAIGDVDRACESLLNSEATADSSLPKLAKAYPVVSLLSLVCSVALLIVV